MILATLLAISSSLAAFLALKVKTLQKEHERLRNLTNEDSKVLFLKSRYASMGETLGNIAHQWKQPLNAIGTIQNSIKAALLFQGEISKEKLMSSVDTSFKLLQHLAETIDTFYSFLAQSGDSTSHFYLADELDKVRKITEYSFENSNINLVFELEINPSIQGNANELTHALLNLILNAKDAFDTLAIDNPTITVRVVGREETCTITVTDNAGGIRIKPIDMVFDMHITSKENGSGLGLFMTKNIIEKRFGGSISVKNTKNGACFTIDLPYADYHEHYETITRDERLTLDRINQLSRKVIELEEVEKNLRKWSEIFKKAHWAIAMHVGTSNRFDLTNDAFNALYGYSAEEMRQLSVPDLFTPESLPILSEIQTIAFDKGYVAFESTHQRRDGSTFPVSVELMVIKDEEGDILYHMANIWDLSEKKAAEERLLLKKFALDHIRDAVFLIDANARFHYVNEGACNALGYTREEMLHMSIGDVDPDWPNERWPEHWEELKQEGSITMELRHRRKDGTIFPVEVSANYIEYNGRYYNMAVARDITERKAAQEKLLLQTFALDQVNEAVFLIDENSMFHYVNDGACKALGYTKEELLRMGVVHLDPNVSIEWWRAHWDDIIALGTTLTQTKHIKKDGSFLSVEVSSNSFEYDGVWYSLAVSRDITERLALEAEKESRAIRVITENSPDIIVRFDLQGHRTYVNPKAAELFKIDMLGKTLLDVTPVLEKERFAEHLRHVLQTGEEITFETGYINAEGQNGWAHIRMVPELDSNGKIMSVLSIGRDMTELKNAYETLAYKERELRSLAESSPGMMGAYYMRPDASVCMPYASPNIQEIFGITSEEIKEDATPLMALTHPDDAEMVVRTISESAQTMSLWHIEYRIIHPTKGVRWMEGHTMPQTHPSGGVVWYGYVHDITERKAMEEQIRENEQKLQKAQQIAKVGSWHLDIQNEQLTWSDETYRIFEFDRSEITDLHHTFYEHVHPEDRERVRGLYVESLYAKTSYELDHRIIMSDGSIKYIIERCEHTYAPDGTPLYSNGTVQDITERKLMEKELQDSHAFLTKLIDSLPDPIFVKDRDHKWLILNKANYEFAGIEQGSFIGKSDYDFFPKEEADVFWEKDEEVFKSGKVNVNEEYFTSSDGITHYIQTIKAMFVGSDGKEYLVGTIRDLSERKKMEDALRQALEFNEGVISAIPDMLFEIAPDGTYVGIWAQNEDLLIQQRTTLLGKNFKEVLPPDVVITSIQAMKEVDEKGLSLGKTYSLDLPEGKRWFELSVSKKKMSGNYIALARDITDRKQAEEAIKELNATLEQKVKERTQQFQQSLEFSEGVINALPDLLFEIDINGIYLNVWARDEKILAAQKEFLIGHSLYDVLSKESADSVMEGIKEASAEGVSFGKVIKIDLPQGTRYFEESFSKKVSSNTFLVLSHDITDRVEADQKLRESEEMFRALVENSPDVISRYDLSMRRTYVNPMMQLLLDKPLDEILGKTPREFSPLPDVEVFEQLFNAVVQGKSELEYEGVFTAPWGEQRWGNQRIIPEFDTNHNVNGVMIIGRDMTERVETEKRLKLLETAVNNTKDAVYIIDKDKSIIYVNNAVSEMLGYTFEELTQMKIYAIDTHLDSQQIKNITNEIEKTIIFDTKHQTKDGRIINVEVALTLFDYDGVGFGVSFVKEISK